MSTLYNLLWHTDRRFAVFGPTHLAGLALFAALAALLIWFGRSPAPPRAKAAVRVALGACIALFETLYVLYPLPLGTFDARYSLPLQICDITAYAAAFALIAGWPTARELAYFMGLSTTLLASFTPDMTYDFPHVEFICFFVSHALVVAAVLYMLLGLGQRPRPGAAWRVFLLVNAYCVAIALVNLLLGSNYVYLCYKPQVGSPMDWLGPWPYYVAVMDLIFAAVLALLSLLLRRGQPRQPAHAEAARNIT